jgi:ketosteroid isomerase-like protein
MRKGAVLLGIVAIALACVWAWRAWWPSDELQIRRRLQTFAADFNTGTSDGLAAMARAAQIASYFTSDISVDLGKGTPPIQGRETLAGMAARLQPRTAAFTLELVDVNVEVSGSTANVSLTAAFKLRSLATGDESVDARELSVGMVKQDGLWRISRVNTVEAFR